MNLDEMKNDVEYWRGLNPALSIGASFDETSIIEISPELMDAVSNQFQEDGYLCLPPLLDTKMIKNLRDAMFALKAAHIPSVYIYLYDEAWFAFKVFSEVISRFLGDDYALLPNFWAWHLDTAVGAAGWPPHQDCQAQTCFPIDSDSSLYMSLSLWVPLTDADLDNGCMMVLPKKIEKSYKPILNDADDIDLTDGHALPARAGSLLGWNQELYHWSSQVTGAAKNPRISLSLEFQNTSFAPLSTPLLDAGAPPSFTEKLALIETQFEKYKHIDKG